ncbi:MAG: hypothetical protein EZS28_034145 [Streblomastix strix]|uniref:Transmembrane protein n=1 Tax=Streblomastix strix TaxID=222440 RepID=A0A5J4UHZ9_9EUKA|nr:MAG: hypothetical protein EZS28_034145 [Streblomastix strix]
MNQEVQKEEEEQDIMKMKMIDQIELQIIEKVMRMNQKNQMKLEMMIIKKKKKKKMMKIIFYAYYQWHSLCYRLSLCSYTILEEAALVNILDDYYDNGILGE